MNKKIKVIIYLIVVAVVIFLSLKALKQDNGIKPEILDNVVILDEAKVLPENEGKLVLISGKVETDYYLTDDDLGLELDTCKAKKSVEMYQYTIKNDELDYKWDENVQYEYVTNDSGRRFYNPEKSIESSETCDEAYIGEFLIPEGLTKQLPYNATIKDLPKIDGFRIKDDYLTNSGAVAEVGDLRIRVSYTDLEKLGEVSILAKQVGDSFEEYKLNTNYNAFNVYQNKITNKDELGKQIDQNSEDMKIMIIVVIIVIIIIGIVLFREDIKNLIEKTKSKNN